MPRLPTPELEEMEINPGDDLEILRKRNNDFYSMVLRVIDIGAKREKGIIKDEGREKE